MLTFFVIAVIVLFFIIIFQIAKASEYVSVLKGEEKANEDANRINGFLMLAFLIAGLLGIWWCQVELGPKILPTSASKEGVEVDNMMWWTLGVTGVVLIITQVLLFYFSYKYQYKKDRKTYYYPHNNKLEALWTAIPAIVMTGLVTYGLINWYKMTKEAPKGKSYQVGVIGQQFNWWYQYPGADGKLGRRNVKNIIPGVNDVGLDFTDPNAVDDIVTNDTLRLIKDTIVDITIQSRDVIHDVGLSQFRMKMDAVPDMPTKMKFTPIKTSEEMKKITNDPDYQYEISCDQMCGASHYKMRGVITVYDKKWSIKDWNETMKKDGKVAYAMYQDYIKKEQEKNNASKSVTDTLKNTKAIVSNY
jgi:cytochrome c oxidase subunit II